MNLDALLNNLNEDYSDIVTIEISCTENAAYKSLLPLIEYIKRNGSTGHSFEIEVEPNETKENGKRTFDFDGDGPDKIIEIKINDDKYVPTKGIESKLQGK